VQESAILRLIGRIGATAVSEYDAEVERQGDRWMHAALLALASDVASPPTTTKSPD
jgi:hypothetical protein